MELFLIQRQPVTADLFTGPWLTVLTAASEDRAVWLVNTLSRQHPDYRWQGVSMPFYE